MLDEAKSLVYFPNSHGCGFSSRAAIEVSEYFSQRLVRGPSQIQIVKRGRISVRYRRCRSSFLFLVALVPVARPYPAGAHLSLPFLPDGGGHRRSITTSPMFLLPSAFRNGNRTNTRSAPKAPLFLSKGVFVNYSKTLVDPSEKGKRNLLLSQHQRLLALFRILGEFSIYAIYERHLKKVFRRSNWDAFAWKLFNT